MNNILKTILSTCFLATASQQAFSAGDPMDMHRDSIYSKLLIDRLEYANTKEDALIWDANFWIGGDYTRLMFKTEGETADDSTNMTMNVVYSQLIAPFWDIQAGLAMEGNKQSGDHTTRPSFVAGFMGLAPYWFETDVMLYISDEGDVSSIIEAEYEWLITQRTVLQARMETLLAVQQVPEFDVEPGINFIETGLRLRYEIKREFAPYLGINYKQLTGKAANNADKLNKDSSELAVLAGVRFWF